MLATSKAAERSPGFRVYRSESSGFRGLGFRGLGFRGV